MTNPNDNTPQDNTPQDSTTNDTTSNDTPPRDAIDPMNQAIPDKLYDHNRQQLSAMLDGALSPDEARFMLRRLQHDTELASCWERWQVCGDVLRGQRNALLPADFSQRIARAIASDHAVPAVAAATGRPRWARWGGGAALAASVAVAALFVARQTPSAIDPATADPAAQVVAASSPSTSPATGVETIPPAPTQPIAPDASTQLAAAAVAVAEVPRRAAARRSRGQSQRAALRTLPSRFNEVPVIVAAAANAPAAIAPPIGSTNANTDPFAAQALAPSRPWPRAIVPSYPATGAFTVDYGSTSASSFYPFEPRVDGQAGDGARENDDATTTAPRP